MLGQGRILDSSCGQFYQLLNRTDLKGQLDAAPRIVCSRPHTSNMSRQVGNNTGLFSCHAFDVDFLWDYKYLGVWHDEKLNFRTEMFSIFIWAAFPYCLNDDSLYNIQSKEDLPCSVTLSSISFNKTSDWHDQSFNYNLKEMEAGRKIDTYLFGQRTVFIDVPYLLAAKVGGCLGAGTAVHRRFGITTVIVAVACCGFTFIHRVVFGCPFQWWKTFHPPEDPEK